MERNRLNAAAASGVSPFAAVCIGLVLQRMHHVGHGLGLDIAGRPAGELRLDQQDGGVTGTMAATLSDGRAFTGPYLEITSTAQSSQFYPMWAGWQPGWSDWEWGMDGTTTTYTGKVVANLQGPDSRRMRCRFDLNNPPSGMSGGGQGKCQFAGGTTVDAVFPRA